MSLRDVLTLEDDPVVSDYILLWAMRFRCYQYHVTTAGMTSARQKDYRMLNRRCWKGSSSMIGHCAFALVASDRFRTQSISAVSCIHPSSINLSSYATHIVSLIVLRALSTAYRRPRPRAPAAAASDAAAFASTPRAHRRRSRAANAPAAMDSGIIDLDSGWLQSPGANTRLWRRLPRASWRHGPVRMVHNLHDCLQHVHTAPAARVR
jgi:hypothetical protein